MEKININFIWSQKRPWIAKANLIEKNNPECVAIPDFKVYYRVPIIKYATGMKTCQKE